MARETTRERETRMRAENYAAMRATITDAMRQQAGALASLASTRDEIKAVEFPAGDEITLKAGRRTITVDFGEIERLAFADAVETAGWSVIAHGVTFGLYAGRSTVRYTVTVA